jgi:transcriptional regulator with XRE-family HTH domain
VELRRARTRAGLTQKEVANDLDWSPSKVIRIESGQVAISTTDLKALLAEYGVTDSAVVSDLVDLARSSKKQPWSQYKDVLSSEVQAYFGYESSAVIIRQFEPLLVPGLLQTEDYTRALLANAYGIEQRWVERLLETRRARQEILEREEVPEAFFIIDEAVIRRAVGSPEIMRHQLQQLLSYQERPQVTLQVMPFTAGAQQGLQGPFVLLEFAEQLDPESPNAEDALADESIEPDNFLVYLESRSSMSIRDQPEVMGEFLERFLELEKQAASPEESADMIKSTLNQY